MTTQSSRLLGNKQLLSPAAQQSVHRWEHSLWQTYSITHSRDLLDNLSEICWAGSSAPAPALLGQVLARCLHAKNSSGALQLLPKGPGEQLHRQDLPQQEGPQRDWKGRLGPGDAQQEAYLPSRSNSKPAL